MRDASILIAEDDTEIRQFLSLYLSKHGYRIVEAADGRQALQQYEQYKPDLLLLDIVLPEIGGLELCKLVRQSSHVPIIFLSCKWTSADIVNGLEVGADDYVTKPFDSQELLARIKSHLRRTAAAGEWYEFGPLRVNAANCEVSVDNQPVALHTKELQLLLFFVRNPNKVFSAEELYDKIWGVSHEGDYRTVMVHISNLRRKLERDRSRHQWIQTVRGFGYRLHAPGG